LRQSRLIQKHKECPPRTAQLNDANAAVGSSEYILWIWWICSFNRLPISPFAFWPETTKQIFELVWDLSTKWSKEWVKL